MKKLYRIINDEKGYYLSYVMLITTILLLLITSTIGIYRNEIQITENTIEQIKLETLIQMGFASFKRDYIQLEIGEENNLQYEFPDGNVEIQFIQHSETEVNMNMIIRTEAIPRYIVTKRILI
ncbi:competence type IV pilus minor pilin ComGG [Ornithinibacillus halophilus]|uniref:ComG operon protein 7 n=1 Tax=Ornithinibacillus halophilus TaxID=930117 RepID=A0A1M5D1V0_9BACI|nr:competence type IV pilus minor pilin ComGG [Ornithinibacillus halophilus]SHF60805.1 hypothetical protein SAMN05216225_1001480 [Ornithinibacillus halophilus]